MKRFSFTIILALTTIVLVFASDGIIKSFSVDSGGDRVTIKWATENENNVKHFEIERSNGNNNYRKIHTKIANGKASNYSYIDEEAFMKQDNQSNETFLQNVYSYRIKVVNKDNSFSYTDEAYIAHKPSSIRRTWGMIKEMFR